MSDIGFNYTVDQVEVMNICEDMKPIYLELQNFSDEMSTHLSNLKSTRGYNRLSKSILSSFASVGDEYAGLIAQEANTFYSLAGIVAKFDAESIGTINLEETKKWWKTAGATTAMIGLNLLEGFGTGVETFVDGFLTIGAVATDFLGMDGISQWLTDRVENDAVGQFFDAQYESGALQWINENSKFQYDSTAAAVFKGVGTAGAYMALTGLTGKLPGVNGLTNIVSKVPKVGKYIAPGVAEAATTFIGTLGFSTSNNLQDGDDIRTAAGKGAKVAALAAAADLTAEGVINVATPFVTKGAARVIDAIDDKLPEGNGLIHNLRNKLDDMAAAHTPKPDVDGTPKPDVDGTPNTNKGPETTNTNKGPETTNTNKGPETTNTNKGPETTNTNKGPETTNTNKGPETTNTNKGPETTNTNKGPETTNTNKGPETTNTNKGPETTNTNKGPETTNTNKGPETTNTNKGPETTNTNKTSEYNDAGNGYKVKESTSSNGNPQTTVEYPDGTVEVTEIYPDGSTNTTLSKPDGEYEIPATLEETRNPGELVHEGRVTQNGDGSTTWDNEYADGTTQTWTKNRDGTVETTRQYKDGSTETWYKDNDGYQVTETYDATNNTHSTRTEHPDGTIEVTQIDANGTTNTVNYKPKTDADVTPTPKPNVDGAPTPKPDVDRTPTPKPDVDRTPTPKPDVDGTSTPKPDVDGTSKPSLGSRVANGVVDFAKETVSHPGRTGAAIYNHMHDVNTGDIEIPVAGTEAGTVPQGDASVCPSCGLPVGQCNCSTTGTPDNTPDDTVGGNNNNNAWDNGYGGDGYTGGVTGGDGGYDYPEYETPTYPEYEIPTYPEYEMPTYPEYETPTYPDTDIDGSDGNNGNDGSNGDDGSSYPWGDNNWGGGTSGPGASDFVDDLGNSSEDTKVSIEDTLEDATASLDEIIDMTTGVNIPTSANPIKSTINTKDNNMVPLMAGLGAAALAGLGTKAYLDHKENKDNEEEIEAEEWEEDLSESDSLGLQESDYLMPTDEFAYQPEGANMTIEDEGEKYQAVNSSELPSIN